MAGKQLQVLVFSQVVAVVAAAAAAAAAVEVLHPLAMAGPGERLSSAGLMLFSKVCLQPLKATSQWHTSHASRNCHVRRWALCPMVSAVPVPTCLACILM
jgi:hypothetical protein